MAAGCELCVVLVLTEGVGPWLLGVSSALC